MLQKHLPAPIDKLGEQLATEVNKLVSARNLGYYPALNYFSEVVGFPTYLLDAVSDVYALAASIVTDKISDILIPIFSNVQVNNIHCVAYSLPAVRPGKPDAIKELARHYTPNVIKFELVVSLLQRQKPQESFERYADNTVYRWLAEVFEKVEITSARLLKDLHNS
jgi:hypothetical protein